MKILRSELHWDNVYGFAEWMHLNAIRNDEHLWKYRGDNWTTTLTTKEMYNLFVKEQENENN
jgi:hypothetical protein